MNGQDLPRERFYIMHWYLEEVIEVCTSSEEAQKARDRHQPKTPLFPVVIVAAESEAAAKTYLRAWRMSVDSVPRKPPPQTARLQEYIKAERSGDTEAIQRLMQDAQEDQTLMRVIRSWQAEHKTDI